MAKNSIPEVPSCPRSTLSPEYPGSLQTVILYSRVEWYTQVACKHNTYTLK